MAVAVITRSGFPEGLDRDALMAGFVAHNEAVRATIPPTQLLEFEVRQGWEPLCEFLGVAAPDEAFPRSNHREEFWELVKANS